MRGSTGGEIEMLKKESQKFKTLLLKLRGEVLEKMREQGKTGMSETQRNAGGNFSGYATHMADIGTEANEMEMLGNIISSEQKTLFEIDEALIRIEEKTYGKCQNCGRNINQKRLALVPFTKFCRKHEEELEAGNRGL